MFFLFPNYFVLPQFGNALIYRVPAPRGRSRVLPLRAVVGLHPRRPATPSADRSPQGPFAPDDTGHWPAIPLQDFSNIGRQQRGIHSRSIDALRLSRTYEGGHRQHAP